MGDPVVFVHGYLVDGRLWEGTAAALDGEFRCIPPDWPLGSHASAMKPDADLTLPGLARIGEKVGDDPRSTSSR